MGQFLLGAIFYSLVHYAGAINTLFVGEKRA